MGKEGVLELNGEVLELLPAGFFKVKLKEVDVLIRCKKSGKMSQSHISIIAGDLVKVEVSQYDMSQGRIVYRFDNKQDNRQETEAKKI